MHEMDWAETSRFLLQGTRTAKIATVFSTSSRSVKARNLVREPRVAVAVDDQAPPFSFVSITGWAELLERPGDFLAWTTRIAGRYVGADRAAEMGQRFVEIDDLLVRVRIHSLIARAAVVV